MTTAQTGPDQADPLKNAYHQGFITNPLHREFLLHKDVALLC
ncbi:MAG: cysteine hydrolase, partial [Verrucomicrobiota bacterium]